MAKSGAEPTSAVAKVGKPRRARGSLSREEIIKGALQLAAEVEGLDGLSMPRLGKHLSVGVTSIYWYFRSKDELVAALTEEVARRLWELLPENSGMPWDLRLLEYFRAFRRAFIDNPVLADLVVLRAPLQARTPEAAYGFLSLLEREIGALIDAGFLPEDALNAYMTLSVYTRGCVLNQRIYGLADAHANAGGRPQPQPDIDPSGLPVMAMVAPYYTPSFATEEKFEAGIAVIVEGLRAKLAATTHAGPSPNAAPRSAPRKAPGPAGRPRSRKT